MIFIMLIFKILITQYNDIQYNYIQNNNIQYNDKLPTINVNLISGNSYTFTLNDFSAI